MTLRSWRLVAGLGCLAAAALAGCGKKAPLRLPEQRPSVPVGTLRARVRERRVTLEFQIPRRRVFPEREAPWTLARILRRDGARADFVEAGTLLEADGFDFGADVSWSDEAREPGIAYTYRVELLKRDARRRAASPDLEVSWGPEAGGVTNLSAAGGEGSVLLTWQAPEHAPPEVRYQVFRQAPGDRETRIVSPIPLAERRFLDTAVELGPSYCYTVRSLIAKASVEIEGPLSPAACAGAVDHTPPPAPVVIALIPAGSALLLTWQPVDAPDLFGYAVYRAAGEEPFTRLAVVSAPETLFRDITDDLVPGTPYRYRVTALDRSSPPNESAFSAIVGGSLPPP